MMDERGKETPKQARMRRAREARMKKIAERKAAAGTPGLSEVVPALAAVGEPGLPIASMPNLGGMDLADPTLVLGKDPSFVYRITMADAVHFSRAQALGYRAVRREEPEVMPMLDHGRADHLKGYDGGQGGVGLILMKAPRAYVDERKARAAEANARRGRTQYETELQERVRDGALSEKQAALLLQKGYIEERVDV